MKIAFIGSVELSYIALKKMVEMGYVPDIVFSLDEEVAKEVSDYYPLHTYAKNNNIPYVKYNKVQDIELILQKERYDYLFVIGLSQLIPEKMLSLIQEYAIGFHPTLLPKFRGRAPIPWMILLGEKQSAVTLFRIDEGVDSGDIIIQEPYYIEETDYAYDVYVKVERALEIALENSIPLIVNKQVNFRSQDSMNATYLLKRRPYDGEINWNELDGKQILDLIRAVSFPYPYAFSFYNGKKIIFKKATLHKNRCYYGQIGQVAKIEGEHIWILTRDKMIIEIIDYDFIDSKEKIVVGGRFK